MPPIENDSLPLPPESQSPRSESAQPENNIELRVYSRRRARKDEVGEQPHLQQNQEANQNSVSAEGNLELSDNIDELQLPIALRKGVRSCTQHSIGNYVSYSRLSPKYRAFVANLDRIMVPKDIKEALKSEDWKKAVWEEICALKRNRTLDITDLPKGKKPVGCKWVFTVKFKEDGSI